MMFTPYYYLSTAIAFSLAIVYLYTCPNLISFFLCYVICSYGYHVSNNSYYLCYEQENIVKMFTKLRHFNNNSEGEDYTV